MSNDLTFYTHPMSRGRIIRWMMEELERPYRTEVLDFGATMKAPAYLAINPMGKVPAVKHGDVVITEAGAICAYLADAFPELGLAPPHGSKDRAAYYRWLFFAAGPIEQAVTTRSMGWETTEEGRRSVGFGSMEDVLAAIEGAVTGRQFVAGDRFSVADLYLASHLSWGMQFGSIEKRPAFEAYVAPHLARPAAVRANDIDNALLADQQPVEP